MIPLKSNASLLIGSAALARKEDDASNENAPGREPNNIFDPAKTTIEESYIIEVDGKLDLDKIHSLSSSEINNDFDPMVVSEDIRSRIPIGIFEVFFFSNSPYLSSRYAFF